MWDFPLERLVNVPVTVIDARESINADGEIDPSLITRSLTDTSPFHDKTERLSPYQGGKQGGPRTNREGSFRSWYTPIGTGGRMGAWPAGIPRS